MISTAMLFVGVVLAVAILSGIPRVKSPVARGGIGVAALVVLAIFVIFSSVRYVGENQVGIVIKNALGASLPEGKIIATSGEMGPQATTLPPGWHIGLWPIIFDVEIYPLVEITDNEVGLLTATDGLPLPAGQVFAPEWSDDEFQAMLDAQHFLTDGGGFMGPQTSVLRPGKHRLNPKLFKVEKVPVTNVEKATVAVIKSNVGPSEAGPADERVVARGARGIWREPLLPQKYYLNTMAFEVTTMSSAQRTVRYTKSASTGTGDDQREITVRSSDGFTFPVDVRIEYEIKPHDAPMVVANFRDDGAELTERLNSVVRSVFRNNAESVKALDYVQQRSQQESQSLAMIVQQMREFGVTVTAVRIGDVGDRESLGELLKTQTDREIAKQEQVTFQEQQRAAEQRKALARTQQEAEEEKRLATAQYEVQIAERDKERRIIDAQAQAERIRVEAEAQAEAFRVIALQIGRSNAAMIEYLKIVGERGIQITPRVMVVGEAGSSTDAETTALIGTMLDQMVRRADEDDPTRRP